MRLFLFPGCPAHICATRWSEPFLPTGWSDEEIAQRAHEAGIDLPDVFLPGVKANLVLLEDRWATVSAALREEGA